MAYTDQGPEAAGQKTPVAALVAIVMVVPALLPAAIITLVYSYFFNFFFGSSWIPYVDQIGALWFPELLRGMILGAIAIWTSRYFFPRSNVEAVRLATIAFWGAIVLLLLILSVSLRGMTLDIIGVVALIAGLGAGLWAVDA